MKMLVGWIAARGAVDTRWMHGTGASGGSFRGALTDEKIGVPRLFL
jgi:hypothetical protein